MDTIVIPKNFYLKIIHILDEGNGKDRRALANEMEAVLVKATQDQKNPEVKNG